MTNKVQKTIKILQEYSIPLIAGVVIALIWANLAPENYYNFVHNEFLGNLSLHFLVNDIFMAFFFAMATVEITHSLLPGGDLNPLKRAVTPIMSTIGGVLFPAIVYLILNYFFGSIDLVKGWGITTATDIALAWLVARLIFGTVHPAVSFLLLLAIADDGICLIIIALFYPDPLHPITPIWLLLTLAGMLVAFSLRKAKVRSYWPYIIFGGLLSWAGLYLTGVHPSLALVFIVPFLPNHKEISYPQDESPKKHPPLEKFEKDWKLFVDFGLVLFGLTNAGVKLSGISTVTWLVYFGLLFGKTFGVFIMGVVASLFGFSLPKDMGFKDLFIVGLVASMGLTVALFTAGVAFTDTNLQDAAKMGALLSVTSALIAFIASKLLGIKKKSIDAE